MNDNLDRQFKLLIVDGDVDCHALYQKILGDEGYYINTVASVSSYLSEPTGIDLVLLKVEGSEQLTQAEELMNAGLNRALIVMGPVQDDLIQAAFDTGAADYLPLPISPPLLRHHIRQHLFPKVTGTTLRREEEHYRALGQMTTDYAYEIRLDTEGEMHVEWIAGAGLEKMPEIKSQGEWEALIHPEDVHIMRERKERLLKGESATDRFRVVLSGGRVRWLLDSVVPVRNPHDSTLRLYGMGRDITDTYEMAEALRDSQERLSLAIEAGEIGIWDWDMVTNETYFSPRWVEMLGYEVGELENSFLTWENLIHPDDKSAIERALRDHSEKGVAYRVTHRLKSKSGAWKWIDAQGKIVKRSEEGEPLRMAGTHRDIDSTRRIQQALRKSEERHRIISNTISDYAYSYKVNQDGTLKKEWSTQAFHDITGYSFQEVDSDGWSRLIHPDDTEAAFSRFERLLAGEIDVTEFRIITKSGEVRWLLDHGHPVVDEDTGQVTHIYGAAQDITQRKRDEERLQRLLDELQARNEELDAFAYTVAHDLKNPISSMMGFASLVQNYYDRMTEERIQEYLSLIMESGYKLKEIINALLMLAGVSKIEKAELSRLDMLDIVASTRHRLTNLISETQANIIIPDDLPAAVGYAPWVEEVWTNYISNALKYGGSPPVIELGADEECEGLIRFWVRDNGNGLSPDEQRRVFTPFTRLNQAKIEGHGLGLSIVQRIVHKLGGEVGVESSVGEGSTFSFTLPTTIKSDDS